MFLMPSKSEPCGLSQMIALRYGTIPVVREVGGLRDSITDCGSGDGNGYTFRNYDAMDMLACIRRAIAGYWQKDGWEALIRRAMSCDNSWTRSATEYVNMYREVIAEG